MAALLSPTSLHQGKAEGQGVCVATGSSGGAHRYADPVLEACEHCIGIRCLQQHTALGIAGIHFVPLVGQRVEQQLTPVLFSRR